MAPTHPATYPAVQLMTTIVRPDMPLLGAALAHSGLERHSDLHIHNQREGSASIRTRTTSPNPADPDRSVDTDCPTLHHCTDMYSLTAYPHQSLSRRADSVQNRLQPQITHPRAPRMQNARLGKGQLPMWCWPGADVCPPRVRTPAVIRPPSRMAGINISTLGPASRAQGKQQ